MPSSFMFEGVVFKKKKLRTPILKILCSPLEKNKFLQIYMHFIWDTALPQWYIETYWNNSSSSAADFI